LTPPQEPTRPDAPQWQAYARMYPEGGSWQSYAQLYPGAGSTSDRWETFARMYPPRTSEGDSSWQTYAQLYPAAASTGAASWQSYARMYPASASEPPAFAAPGGAAPAAAAAYPDVVSAGPPAQSSRRGVLLGVGALALALVAGAGIAIASRSDSAAGDPEQVIPATAFAFAKIDLDPPTDQKVAIHDFSSKFPKGPKTDATNPMDGFLTEVFKDDTGKCSYEKDIKPWLGKRVGVAAITGAGGKTQPLIAIQVKDAAAAKTALAKTTTGACGGDSQESDLKGFAINKGYALLSTTQADVDQAVKDSASTTLESADNFTADVKKLGGSQVIVMWADITRAYAAIAKESPRLGAMPTALTQQLKGRVVMGLHMESDVAEISARTIGGDVSTVTTGTPTTLGALPDTTVVALTANGLQKQLETQLKALRDAGLPVDDMLSQAGTQFGTDVRKDLLPLFGTSTTFVLGNVPKSALDAKFGMKNTVDDPQAVATTGKQIAEIAKSAGIQLDAEVDGKTFYLTTGGYAAELKAAGTLGKSPKFTKAMGELGDSVSGALYVDISQLASMASGSDAEDLKPLSSFGMSAGKTGEDSYVRMRLVVQ
jgi:hypothetical protein